jgi:hypothetical protein
MKVDNTMQTTKTVKKSKNSFSLKNHMAKHAIVYVFMIPV